MLLRNNGIFAIIAYLLIIVIRYLKEREDCKFLLRTIISVVLAIFFSMGLKTALQATSGSINEALSVPYQQIACAYNDKKDQLSEEEKKEIFKFVPDVEHYDQSLSDPVKYEGRASEDFLGFANLYFEMFARFPGSYFKAFCMLNAGYFSPTDTSFAEIYGTKNRQGIFLTDTKEGFQVEHTSYFPQLEKLYERLYTENKYEKIPVLNISCSPSIYFWILVFLIIYSIYKKQFKLSSITAFLVVFLLTLLASPACLIRYALPLIVCIPIFCTCVLKE